MINFFNSDLINISTAQFDDANCLSVGDPELFFYNGKEKGAIAQIRAAKRVCEGCVRVNDCLQFALDNDIREGIWGGTTEAERRRMKRMKEKAS